MKSSMDLQKDNKLNVNYFQQYLDFNKMIYEQGTAPQH
jgi:hypothetical protein